MTILRNLIVLLSSVFLCFTILVWMLSMAIVCTYSFIGAVVSGIVFGYCLIVFWLCHMPSIVLRLFEMVEGK